MTKQKLSESQIKILRAIEISYILDNTAYISKSTTGWKANTFTIDNIVDRTRLSDSTIRYSLSRLEQFGYVTKKNERYSQWKLYKPHINKIVNKLNRLGLSMIHNKSKFYFQATFKKQKIDEWNKKIKIHRSKKNYNVTVLNNMIDNQNKLVSEIHSIYFETIKKLKNNKL